MSATRSKIEEARFFLGYMEKTRKVSPDFDYFLNAFIGSARSILWVMKAEYKKVTGWEAWYEGKSLLPEERTFFGAINDMRTRSVKRGTLSTGLTAIIDIPPTGNKTTVLPSDIPGEVELIPLDGSEKSKEALRSRQVIAFGTLKEIYQRVDEFPDEDIVGVCRRYLDRLDSLVVECDKLFSRSGECRAL